MTSISLPLVRRAVASLLCTLALAACSRGLRSAGSAAGVAPAAAASAPGAPPSYTAADVHFMSGMILHHAQAVLMAGWAPTHGASPAISELCERINVSQRDEIAAMERWLRERHQDVPDADTAAQRPMAGIERPMAMPGMGSMLMPGMLTGAQLAQLDGARGPAFDQLFLTFMIQHHEGALTMVQDLFNTPGAAQDGLVFQFASDVSSGQAAEIDRMRHMLAAELLGGRSY
jgi:uncharacterized protein (DUF305 family)